MTTMMIEVELDYTIEEPGAAILLLEAAGMEGQQLGSTWIEFGGIEDIARVPAEEGIGERILFRGTERISCRYRAEVTVTRHVTRLSDLTRMPIEHLPGDALRYLIPSRFCESDRFDNVVRQKFGDTDGGSMVQAIRDWTEAHLEYVPGASHGGTSAADTFLDRQGVCRDYAHLMAAMCRAAQIPARVCSVYAPTVKPQDFHAVVQVFLDGDWHLVDPTGMAEPKDMAMIAVGRDATDIAFLTTISRADLQRQSVSVSRRT